MPRAWPNRPTEVLRSRYPASRCLPGAQSWNADRYSKHGRSSCPLHIAALIFMSKTKYGHHLRRWKHGGGPPEQVPVAALSFVYTVCWPPRRPRGLPRGFQSKCRHCDGNRPRTGSHRGCGSGGTSLFGGVAGSLALSSEPLSSGNAKRNESAQLQRSVQDMVLGAIIIITVLLDRARRCSWERSRRSTPSLPPNYQNRSNAGQSQSLHSAENHHNGY